MSRILSLPLAADTARSLRAGDAVELSGEVLTGRDQACARLFDLLQKGDQLPVKLEGELIYFAGPSPTRPGEIIGSVGPTTSTRMNLFLPAMLAAGLRGIMGKGFISTEVKAALHHRGGVYFGAVGGTGALLAQSVTAAKVVAFPDLLSEAIHRLCLRRFPAIVLHDASGGDVYAHTYRNSHENKAH